MSKHQVGYLIFGLFTTLYLYGFFTLSWPFIYFFIGVFIWLFFVIYGSFSIRSNYHVKAINSVKTKEKVVAITFDDGPTEYTLKAIELLNKYAQKATFFCIGERALKHKDILFSIVENGHLIGNHTFSHSKKMGFKKTDEVIQEIHAADEVIEEIIGKKTKYFRPPFGVTNPSIRRALEKTNHLVIGWSIRSLDTIKKDETRIFKRIKKRIQPGSIILLHDTSMKSINILEQLLIYFVKENYKSVTIEQLLNPKS